MSYKKHVIHAAIAAISILAIGVVSGVLLDRTVLLHADVDPHATPTALGLDEHHQAFLQDLTQDLELTEEQVALVHEILSRHQSAVDDAWSAVHTMLQSTIDSVTVEIEAVLDSGQRTSLHEWLVEQHGVSDRQDAGEGH